MFSPNSLWPTELWYNGFYSSHCWKCLFQYRFSLQAHYHNLLAQTEYKLNPTRDASYPSQEYKRSFSSLGRANMNLNRNLNVTSDSLLGINSLQSSLILLESVTILKQVSLWNREEEQSRQMFPLTLDAAPPLMMDLTKIPKSAWFSFDRLPLTLTPSPADPESFSGTSNVRNSLVPSGVRTSSSSSAFCQED